MSVSVCVCEMEPVKVTAGVNVFLKERRKGENDIIGQEVGTAQSLYTGPGSFHMP